MNEFRMRAACLALIAFCGAAFGVSGGEPHRTILVVEGDAVGGVGSVTRIDNLAVNNAGEWIVEADTDHADTEADSVLIKNGGLFLREGNPLAEPVGAAIGSFDSINLNQFSDSLWNLFLDNLPTTEDSGLYFNTELIIQEGAEIVADGFSANTVIRGFFESKLADNDPNVALVLLTVDDPNIPTTVDQAFVRVEYDANSGAAQFDVIAKEGDLVGLKDPVADFETNPHTFAHSTSGQAIFVVDTTGTTDSDTGVVLNGDTPLAVEGDLAPNGLVWGNFGTNTRVDVNNTGGYVIKAVAGGNDLIVRNGEVFIEEGDKAPGTGFNITSFGTGPVLIVDSSDSVLWFADWDDPNTDIDSALFLEDQMLIQEGVTTIDGRLVDAISSVQDGYAVDPTGRFIIAEVTFVGGNNAAVLIEIAETGEPAVLTDVEVVTGTLLSGGLPDLLASDDAYLHTRSGFGQTFIDLHHMELLVSAATAVQDPQAIDLTFESRINEPSGLAQIGLFDHAAGLFDVVGQFGLADADATVMIDGIDAADYVDAQGDVVLSIKHIVFVNFFAFTFESFLDLVDITVH